ncbi:hypothetical protein [Streptomyces sp. NPDC088915]|uniref:hypothetical protein n=1 Tax=Streptomyces sp. NPDC088915 TaxID=3365912 RepID=UPI00381B43F8
MTEQVLADIDEQLKIVSGRRAPFTMVPEWVTVHEELQPQAKALYGALAMHVNISRNDGKVWPTRLALSNMLGWSREQSVDPYIKQLVKAGAITVEDYRRSDGSMGKIYYVHETEPTWHTGPRTVAEFYVLHREKVKAMKAAKKATKKAESADGPSTPAPTADRRGSTPPAAKKATSSRTKKAVDPAETAPAVPDTSAAPEQEPAPAAAAPKAKATKARKEKTPEEIALDKLADEGAHRWWDVEAPKLVAEKKMTSFMGNSSSAFLAVRTLIRQALAAKPNSYAPHVIMAALIDGAQWSPHRTAFDKALRRVSGVQAATGTGRPRLYRDSQWGQDKPTAPSAVSAEPYVPPADEFAVLDDDDC